MRDNIKWVEIAFVIHHYLNAVIIGVSHDNVLVDSETEAVRWIELTVGRAQLTETDTCLHRCVLYADVAEDAISGGVPLSSGPPGEQDIDTDEEGRL